MASYPDVTAMQEQAAFAVDPSVQYPPMTPHHPVPLQQPNYPDNQPPGVVPTTPNINLQPASGPTSAVKPRLRKACDACSLRKVKVESKQWDFNPRLAADTPPQCDESQPCRPCASLNLECKFERPSKRRGPPNKHAETLKRQRLDPSGQSGPSSPTHAAETLASFAQQQVLSIESIAHPSILYPLIDEYFSYVHPFIPIPHEPTFREHLNRREDLKDPAFLALVSAMVGCVVAALPRRSRHYLRSLQLGPGSPAPILFIDRCHTIAIQAREANYLDREIVLVDAMVSYLLGVTGVLASIWNRARIYLEQALTMSRLIGLSKTPGPDYIDPDGAASVSQIANGHDLHDSLGPPDYIRQELGRRTFWLIFVAVKRLQQLGMPSEELIILPAGKSLSYPPLPLEVDDRYIMQDHVLPQPQGMIPEIAGFNAIARVYLSYNKLSISEVASCVFETPAEDIQKRLIEQSIQSIKQLTADLPADLVFSITSRTQNLSSQQNDPQLVQNSLEPQQASYPDGGQFHDLFADRRRALLDIQKEEIAATELGSRLYVLEKYFSMPNTQSHGEVGNTESGNSETKTTGFGPGRFEQPSDGDGSMEQDMVNEQEEITKRVVSLLGTLNQYSVGCIEGDLISKLESLATTLLRAPRSRKRAFALHAEGFLNAFIELLENLGYLDSNSQRGLAIEVDDNAQMSAWAEFTGYQAKYASLVTDN